MWRRLIEFFRRRFRRRETRPTPVAADAQAPAPDPVTVIAPAPVPVPPPLQPPAQPVVEPWPRTLHFFCEAHDAERYDDAGLHANCIVHAIKGLSRKARTVRCIHPWYDPFKVSPSDAVMGAWFREAKWSGCAAVSVDWEGWTKSLEETQRLVNFARGWGVPLILVPKWTLDPSGEYYFGAKTQAEIVATLNQLKVPALLPWIYMGSAAWRRLTIRLIYRDNGYTGQIIGMTDGGMREGDRDRRGNPYGSVAEAREFMAAQAADGQSVGLFNVPPQHSSVRFALDLYR